MLDASSASFVLLTVFCRFVNKVWCFCCFYVLYSFFQLIGCFTYHHVMLFKDFVKVFAILHFAQSLASLGLRMADAFSEKNCTVVSSFSENHYSFV